MTYYSRSTSNSPLEIEESTIPELDIMKSYRAKRTGEVNSKSVLGMFELIMLLLTGSFLRKFVVEENDFF